MKFIINVLNNKNVRKFKHMLLPSAARLLDLPNCSAWCAETETGAPAGCLVAWNEDGVSYLRSLYIMPEYRHHKNASALFKTWENHAAENSIKSLHSLVSLPKNELIPLAAFLKKMGFPAGSFSGEVFTFNTYTIRRGKFVSKTLHRSAPLLPSGWRAVRYSSLTNTEKCLLDESREALFASHFAYDIDYDKLDKAHSFAFFKNSEIMGYISQTRLTPNIVSVPVFAANPHNRGAGLVILKYYIFAVHTEMPEIFYIRCHFTSQTETGKKLFLMYSEGKYTRHALEYYFIKNL